MAMRSHGYYKTRTYNSWSSMKTRCYNANFINYHRYGGRGIKVDSKWMSFEGFLKDMGERPPNTSLDRIDNDGNYEKSNCRWATRKEQRINTSKVHAIEMDGKTLPISIWAERLKIPEGTIRSRITKGKWDEVRALKTPIKTRTAPIRREDRYFEGDACRVCTSTLRYTAQGRCVNCARKVRRL